MGPKERIAGPLVGLANANHKAWIHHLFLKLINCIVKLHNVSLLLAACQSNSKVSQIPLYVNINTWLVRIHVRWMADTACKTGEEATS